MAVANFFIISSLRATRRDVCVPPVAKLFFSSLEKKNDSGPAACQYAFALRGKPGRSTTGTRRARKGGASAMTVGIRHDDLRRRNRAMVIAAVRRAGQPSRTEIAGTTGAQPFDHFRDLVRPDRRRRAGRGEGRRRRPAEAWPAASGDLAQSGGRLDRRRRAVAELAVGDADRLFRAHRSPSESLRLPTLTLPRDELVAATDRRSCAADRRARPSPAGPVMRIVLAIQGITDAGIAHHAVVADHAAHRHPVRPTARGRDRHSGDGRERLQHDRAGASFA